MSIKVLIWTVMPNHYQGSFFDALRKSGVDLLVRYYEKTHSDRIAMGWQNGEQLPHGEAYVGKKISEINTIPDWLERIHVVPGYQDKFLRKLARELCRKKIPWVHWSEQSHQGLRWWFTYPVKKWYAKMVNTYSLGAFGIGSTAIDDFSRWGISRKRTAFLPYVTPPLDLEASPDPICEDFCCGRKAFLFLGSLNHRKGIDILLKSFAYAAAKSNDWVLLLVGDDRGRGEYQSLARSLAIAEKVCFRGAVSVRYLSSVLKTAKVLVLPSRFDGWGVVLNEGASMGLALIGSDKAGASFHIIDHGKNGFIVKSRSVNSLAQAMICYVQNQELAEQHGKHSMTVFQQFTPERNVHRFLNAIMSWQSTR